MLLPKESWLLQLKKPIAESTHFINLLTLPPSTAAISQENCDILLTSRSSFLHHHHPPPYPSLPLLYFSVSSSSQVCHSDMTGDLP
jgi:hypothetical protein